MYSSYVFVNVKLTSTLKVGMIRFLGTLLSVCKSTLHYSPEDPTQTS